MKNRKFFKKSSAKNPKIYFFVAKNIFSGYFSVKSFPKHHFRQAPTIQDASWPPRSDVAALRRKGTASRALQASKSQFDEAGPGRATNNCIDYCSRGNRSSVYSHEKFGGIWGEKSPPPQSGGEFSEIPPQIAPPQPQARNLGGRSGGERPASPESGGNSPPFPPRI